MDAEPTPEDSQKDASGDENIIEESLEDKSPTQIESETPSSEVDQLSPEIVDESPEDLEAVVKTSKAVEAEQSNDPAASPNENQTLEEVSPSPSAEDKQADGSDGGDQSAPEQTDAQETSETVVEEQAPAIEESLPNKSDDSPGPAVSKDLVSRLLMLMPLGGGWG